MPRDPENVIFDHVAGLFEARVRGIEPTNCAAVVKNLGELAGVYLETTPYELDEASRNAAKALRMSLDWQQPEGTI